VLDEFMRECIAIEVAHSISAQTVVDLLGWLALTRGTPEHIRAHACVRLNNGSEFIAKAVQDWLEKTGCQTIYITTGIPWENPYIESFTGTFKAECLNRELFANLEEARVVVEAWREEYNGDRVRSLVARTAHWTI
jgi:transposase InsO family protein